VLVQVTDDQVTGVQRLILDRARWAVVSVDLTGIGDELIALRQIAEAIQPAADQADGRLIALRVRLTGMTRLHRSLKAETHRFSDEIQAAAHRCHEDIWLERLRVETSDAEALSAGGGASVSLDLAAMLDELEHEPAIRAAASELIASIVGKFPGGVATGEIPLGHELINRISFEGEQ
jgi:hypothetical protein